MSGSGRRIIYVPGIRPKPPPALHREAVWRCLVEGVRRADPAAAARLADAPPPLELVSWSHLFYEEYRDIGLDADALRRLLEPEREPASRPGRARAVRLLAHRLGDRFPVLIGWLAAADTRLHLEEANRYFDPAGGRAAQIRALLARALQETWDAGADILLLTHSLGSVIAWDTLWELSRQGRAGPVDLFITLGSPLANRFVRDRLLGAHLEGAESFPRGIRRWKNYAAAGDLTALGRRMAVAYAEMRRLGLVGDISDCIGMYNGFVGEDGPNFHRCYGYFVSAELGAALAAWFADSAEDASGFRGRPPDPRG